MTAHIPNQLQCFIQVFQPKYTFPGENGFVLCEELVVFNLGYAKTFYGVCKLAERNTISK
jgi:hypothetical protein